MNSGESTSTEFFIVYTFLDVVKPYEIWNCVSSDEGLLLWAHFDRVKVYTQADGKVNIHPKSVNAEEREFNYKWLIYHLKMKTSSVSRVVSSSQIVAWAGV